LKPSPAPSSSPTLICPIEELLGQTFYVRVDDKCAKFELFVDGKVTFSQKTNPTLCGPRTQFVPTPISTFGSFSGNKAKYLAVQGGGGYAATFTVISQPGMTGRELVAKLRLNGNIDVQLKIDPCYVQPSISPSTKSP
jgi:hypothetical protein